MDPSRTTQAAMFRPSPNVCVVCAASTPPQIETPKADPSRITQGWSLPKLPEFKPELKVRLTTQCTTPARPSWEYMHNLGWVSAGAFTNHTCSCPPCCPVDRERLVLPTCPTAHF